MPKFREWRSRTSTLGGAPDFKSQRCKECRQRFQRLSSSSSQQTCSRCVSKRLNESEETSDYLRNQTRFIPVKDYKISGMKNTAAQVKKGTSNSMFSSGFGPYSLYRKTVPEANSLRESGIQNRGHTITTGHAEKQPEIIDLSSDDEVDATVSNDETMQLSSRNTNQSSIVQRLESDPVWLAEKIIKQEAIESCSTTHASFFQGTSEIANQSCESSGIFGKKQISKESVGIQTDTTPLPLTLQKDASVQVELVPKLLFNLLQEQTESSTALEVPGGKQEMVKRFETEITAISTDPALLELIKIRTELLASLENLKLKLIEEKSRLASKKRAMISTGEKAKRLLCVINATRQECKNIRHSIQLADKRVFNTRCNLQTFEEQVATTKKQLFNETDKQIVDVLKNNLENQEGRVAIEKCDLQRNIQQRVSAHTNLKDTEQNLRDKEDSFKIWWNRAKRGECEWHVNSAGLVAVEKEAAFIQSQISNIEQRSAIKILDLIEKREALLNYEHQHLIRDLLVEKEHYIKLVLSNQAEKEFN